MNEQYVYLTHADDNLCELYQQKLQDAGIPSKLEDYTQSAFFRTYGANALLGKKIMVPESELEKAKKVLNIAEND